MKQISSIIVGFTIFGLFFSTVSEVAPYVFADEQNEIVVMSDPRITDSFGNVLSEISMSQYVQIVSDITNTHHTSKNVAFVVTVTHDGSQSTKPQWITMSLNPDKTLSPGLSWSPQNDGTYTVKTEIWDNPISKNVLSSYEFFVSVSKQVTDADQSPLSGYDDLHDKTPEDVTCNSDRILVLRDNGNLACVTEQTAKKAAMRLGWSILSDETMTLSKIIPTANKFALSDPKITDSFGHELIDTTLNKQIQIVADITNKENTSQDFAYTVTITDEFDAAIEEKWFTATLEPHQTFTGSLSWIPEQSGIYVINAIVSDDPSRKSISDIHAISVVIEEVD